MNYIEFVRGDTPTLSCSIKYKSGEIIPIEDMDTLILTCRRRPDRISDIIFEKNKEDFRLEDNEYRVTLKPEDTQELVYSDGIFCFDIEVTLKTGLRKTKNFELNIEKDCSIHGGDDVGD